MREFFSGNNLNAIFVSELPHSPKEQICAERIVVRTTEGAELVLRRRDAATWEHTVSGRVWFETGTGAFD